MFGRNKAIPKSQQPDKSPFTLYHPNGPPKDWKENYYQVVSIDPSELNFGFRIERRYLNGYIVPLAFDRISFGPPPIRRRRNTEGKLVPIDPPPDPNLPVETYLKITAYLNQFTSFYWETHMFIMERQLPHNYKAVRISQHVLSYYLAVLSTSPLSPVVMEVDPRLKSKELGCPRGLNERQNKMWLIQKAMELCQIRGDIASYDQINTAKKKDDLADTICQVEAIFHYLRLPLTVDLTGAPRGLTLTLITGSTSANGIPEEEPKVTLENFMRQGSGLKLEILPCDPSGQN